MKRQRRLKNKLILGVTGCFASGKSTVTRILGSFGARSIDADKIAHRCIEARGPAYRKVVLAFGQGVLKKNGEIDRSRLARAVFGQRRALKKLNRIIHPPVIRAIRKKIKSLGPGIIVLDAPLLIESGLKRDVDVLLVVKINRKEQLRRLKEKYGLTKIDILKRIQSQIPLRLKVRLADFVIDNSGSISETRKQVAQIRRLLWRS